MGRDGGCCDHLVTIPKFNTIIIHKILVINYSQWSCYKKTRFFRYLGVDSKRVSEERQGSGKTRNGLRLCRDIRQ